MGDYTKTTWVAGAAPGISAARLNNLETQYDEAASDLTTHTTDTTTAHSAVSTATANKIIVRDAAGRAKVVAPSAEDDIALKSNVTTVQTNLATVQTNLTTHEAEKATDAAFGHVEVDNTTIQAVAGVIGVPADTYMSANIANGYTEYNIGIGSGELFTRTIPIGSGKKFGYVCITKPTATVTDRGQGVLVFVTTNSAQSFMVGHSNLNDGGAVTRRYLGRIAGGTSAGVAYNFGYAVAGELGSVSVMETYIDGTDLKLVVRSEVGSENLYAQVDYMVW